MPRPYAANARRVRVGVTPRRDGDFITIHLRHAEQEVMMPEQDSDQTKTDPTTEQAKALPGATGYRLRWPRGRYNGQRIQGFKVSVAVHVLDWVWRPRLGWNFGQPYVRWLCVTIRGETEYELFRLMPLPR